MPRILGVGPQRVSPSTLIRETHDGRMAPIQRPELKPCDRGEEEECIHYSPAYPEFSLDSLPFRKCLQGQVAQNAAPSLVVKSARVGGRRLRFACPNARPDAEDSLRLDSSPGLNVSRGRIKMHEAAVVPTHYVCAVVTMLPHEHAPTPGWSTLAGQKS